MTRACSDRIRWNGFNKEGRVRLDISKKFFYSVLRTDFPENLWLLLPEEFKGKLDDP